MRCFVAIDVPDPVRALVADLQAELGRADADVRWVGAETLHVTLRFLGDLEAPALQTLADALVEELAAHAPLRIGFDRVGAFPESDEPRVVWIGSTGDPDALAALAATVDRVATWVGLPADRLPFVAHLTVGRVRASTPALVRAIGDARVATAFDVSEVVLYQSTLTPDGPVYAPLARFPLAGTSSSTAISDGAPTRNGGPQ